MADLVDVFAPAAPGSLMRMAVLDRPGRYRLARRSCEVYSIQIVSAGDWGKAWARTGTGRPVWHQPSTFTGSFWLSGGCEDGLIMELFALNTIIFEVNWREPDRRLI
jgi:hypothetical protein